METFEIDPRKYKKSVAYSGGLLLVALALAGLGISVAVFADAWAMAYIIGGILVIGIPVMVSTLGKVQTLVAGDDLAIYEYRHTIPVVRTPRSKPLEITLEHIETVDSVEAVLTLNLWYWNGWGRGRYMLGMWIDEEAKKQLMHELAAFLARNGFEVSAKNKEQT